MMAGTSGSQPVGSFEPSLAAHGPSLPFTTSSTTTIESTEGSNGTITLTALHGMLARVLEQTTTLCQEQASTNRVLDELRQSIPAPQENAEIHERLRRVEALAETLAHSERVDLHPLPRPGQGTGTFGVPQPSFVPNVGEPRCDPQPPLGPTTSTQETTRDIGPILHASGEQHLISGPSVHSHPNEDVEEEVRVTTLPSASESYHRAWCLNK